mgnify:CR=1 FL=1
MNQKNGKNSLGIDIIFEGSGTNELARVARLHRDETRHLAIGTIVVRIDERYFRPTEVESLLGDAALARKELAWTPRISAQDMCIEMVKEDLKLARVEASISNPND